MSGYRKALVYFIDVLGTKAADFDKLLHIANIFHDEMEDVQKRHNPKSHGTRRVMAFSDCAYIIYAPNEEWMKNDRTLHEYLYTSFFNTSLTLCHFAAEGFLCRGGAAYGDIYFEDRRSSLFGPAVNEAYKIESQEAKYPRIMVESRLAESILEFDKQVKLENPLARKINGEIILKDPQDDAYFINYFNVFTDGAEYTRENGVLAFDNIRRDLQRVSISTIADPNSGPCVMKKHEWNLWYLNEAKRISGNNLPLEEADFLNYLRNLNK